MEKRLVRIAGALLDMSPAETNAGAAQCAGRDVARARYELSQAVVNAVNDRLSEPHAGAEAVRDLRERLSAYAAMPTDNIRCFSSPEAAIETVIRTYLEHGAEAVVSAPAQGAFAVAAQATGAKVIPVDHDNPFDPQIEAVINHIGPRTRMVFIENPNRATGAAFSEAEIVFLLAYAEATMVVVDEGLFEHGGRTVAELVKRFPNLIVIRVIAAEFGMGPLSVGYALTDAVNLQYLDRISTVESNSHFLFGAAAAALGDLGCLARNQAQVAQSRTLFSRHLTDIGYVFEAPPTDFLLLKVANMEFALRLFADSGCCAEELSRFEGLENYVRVELGDPESAELLLMELSLAAGQLATGFNRNRMAEKSEVPVNNRLRQEVKLGQSNR